jgi:hypothetical protein
MTYLDIVNNILRRLRERTVSTVNETSYSALIAILVNDAKEEVENAWQWSALRTTLSATTTANTFNYELNGSRNRLTILDVVNDTSNFFMEYKTAHEMNDLFLNSTPETGEPRYYSFNGVSTADGDTLVDLYPIPNGAYNLRFNVVLRSTDLVNDSDDLLIPAQPVIQLAYAKAVEERGEDGGQTGLSAYLTAQRVASDAIALDAAKHPEETIWYTV